MRLLRFLREQRNLLLFLGLMLLFRSAYADWMIVPTGSMNPTVLEGDYIFVDKNAYGWRVPFTHVQLTRGAEPQRGEIAVFDSPADGTRLVKRVIGVPGDTVAMRNEVLFINGQPLRYTPYVSATELLRSAQRLQPQFALEQLGEVEHAVMWLPQVGARRDFGPVIVPADRYLMLGDNRDNSADSRYFGLVPRDRFTGHAHHVLVSFNPDQLYLPRATRFWKPLDERGT